MIATGNVESYLGNENYIESPDERLKYDKLPMSGGMICKKPTALISKLLLDLI
jgi:hypothetical protein